MKSSKKRVLSSEQSETGYKQKKKKKQREGTRNESTTSTLGDVFCQRFEESWLSIDFRKLFTQFRTTGKKTFYLAKKSSKSQIKG